MRAAAKSIARGVLTAPPLYPVLRSRALRGRALTVLCYHTLGPDGDTMDAWTVLRAGDFRRQVQYLRRHYEIVDLDTALAPAPRPGRPRAVLTFDDGDVGLAEHLLPILEAERAPCTIYVATSQIESGEPYWFDRVMNALQAPGPIEVDLTQAGSGAWTVGPGRGPARWAVISDVLDALKRVPPDDREELVEAVIAAAPPASPRQALGPMSIDALRELSDHPLVTIGAHSHCHNLLDQVPLEDARTSIVRSRELLEDWTRSEVRHLAWPNGNHDADLRASARALGFSSAAALDMDLAHPDDDPFALPRVGIGRYDVASRFRYRLLGRVRLPAPAPTT